MIHILLVEDDPDIQYLITQALQSEGYNVTTAVDGHAALKKFHMQVPDLILLDLMMPNIDGMEVCWRLRAFTNVPIIIISGQARDTDRFLGFQAGADAYFTKPFNIIELLTRIKKLLHPPFLKQFEFNKSPKKTLLHKSKIF